MKNCAWFRLAAGLFCLTLLACAEDRASSGALQLSAEEETDDEESEDTNTETPVEETEISEQEGEEGTGGESTEGGDEATEGGDESTEGGDEPTEGGDEPTEGGDEPTEGGDEPTEGGDAPTEGGDEPTEGGDEPTEGGDEPTEGGDEPTEGGDEPTEGGDEPTEGGDEPTEGGETSTGQDSEWVSGQCNTDMFLDVGNTELYEGPGGGYGVPSLTVDCTEFTMVVQSNGLPHYAYQDMTPNGLSAQNFNWEIPLSPEIAQASTEIPLLGTVGFAVNGIPLYGPNEGPFPDPFGDPIANDVMDWCIGHTGGNADYHYHGFDEACLDKAVEGPSQIVGFALDGFPIYGPRGCLDAACEEVVTFKSSYNAINYEAVDCTDDTECGETTTCSATMIGGEEKMACIQKDYAWENNVYEPVFSVEHLDECNGRVGPDGEYRYHATSTFPYGIACYRGTVSAGSGTGEDGPGEEGGDGEGQSGGPTSCETNADCVGECNNGGTGCVCHETLMGNKLCVPTCDSDADCPTGMMGNQLTCNDAGICTPGMMGTP